MKILVTGGAGYIGSHICVELLQAGMEVIVLDNLYNASRKALERVKQISGRTLTFYQIDIMDKAGVRNIFDRESIDCVIHAAGLKAVGESVENPMKYYRTNLGGLLNVMEEMQRHGVKNIIFSSSATVYGDPEPDQIPLKEDFPKGTCSNPYGWTKWMQEQILTDIHMADPEWNAALLRYFNPIGAHESGLIGEDQRGIPANLLPYISQVAIGKRPYIQVFGSDYPTPDGTAVRDYIHVTDLARGHVKAIDWLYNKGGLLICNLGTGRGYSVLEIIHAFEKACGKELPYKFTSRRGGDIAAYYADCSKAARELSWTAEYGIEEMCRDSWNWQRKNPDGYQSQFNLTELNRQTII